MLKQKPINSVTPVSGVKIHPKARFKISFRSYWYKFKLFLKIYISSPIYLRWQRTYFWWKFRVSDSFKRSTHIFIISQILAQPFLHWVSGFFPDKAPKSTFGAILIAVAIIVIPLLITSYCWWAAYWIINGREKQKNHFDDLFR